MDVFIEAAVKVVVAFVLLMVNTLLLVWAERKIVADMQNRVGPSRAGPWGMLQTLADGVKLFFKEPVTPRKVELGTYLVAPVAAVIPALLIFMVVPIGDTITVFDREVTLVGADLNVGLLFFLAMSSLAVYAVVLAGWASGSKYPLLGGVRATAQAISYEAAMGLAVVPVVLFAGTTSLPGFVEAQSESFGGFLPGWYIFALLPSFILFFIAVVAETNRAPFDLVEAESEIVGGYHTEYSGIRFAMFFLAEYINMFNVSAIAVILFLGGWNGPTFDALFPSWLSSLMPVLWFFLKTWALLFIFIWVRATLPRLRYDQLMTFGWKRLIPLSLGWLILVTLATAVRRFGVPWT
jgi:NADH-quinone oxidoreductase subunit H